MESVVNKAKKMNVAQWNIELTDLKAGCVIFAGLEQAEVENNG